MIPDLPPSPRVLLSSVFRPFNISGPYDAPGNIYELGVFHRSFTRRQGMFTMLQEQPTYPLHLIAHNLDTPTTVMDYPSMEEFLEEVDQGYDVVAVGSPVSGLTKARRMLQAVKERHPGIHTVYGGPGSMGIPEFLAPFSDHVCRGDGVAFLRDLLGRPPARMRFPIMNLHQKVHGLLGLPLKDHNFPVLVTLGCPRRCDFCSTSAQFDGQSVPMFDSGEELYAFMEEVERVQVARGERFSYLSFMVYDENFLLNRPFVEQFRRLNRERALRDPQFLLFTFGDGAILSEYTVEELLEIGIDTIWIGLESPSVRNYRKVGDVDMRQLMATLTGAGIKVIASAIAGLEEHDEETIRRDMEYVLSLPTTGVQYMPVNPIPGTAYYARLKDKGLIPHRDPIFFNMSHYNVRHPTLTEAKVKALLDEYFDREQAENGPLVYRFLHARLQGWRRFRHHANPYVRGRARVFEGDLVRAFPVLVLGERLAPSPATREKFTDLRREVQGELSRSRMFQDTLAGRRPWLDGTAWMLLSVPGVRDVMREVLATVTLYRDPRREGLLEPFLQRAQAVDRAGVGTIPWGQPEPVVTRYPRETA